MDQDDQAGTARRDKVGANLPRVNFMFTALGRVG
jgi:hypothetical protein